MAFCGRCWICQLSTSCLFIPRSKIHGISSVPNMLRPLDARGRIPPFLNHLFFQWRSSGKPTVWWAPWKVSSIWWFHTGFLLTVGKAPTWTNNYGNCWPSFLQQTHLSTNYMSQCRSFRWKFLCVFSHEMRILDIGFPLCGKPRVLSTLLPMLLTRLHHPGSPLAVGGGCGKYGLSYCHHKAFMNLRNHLHVVFWGGTLKLKQKYSVPKNVLRIQEIFKVCVHGFMSWILSWEMLSDLFEIQEGKSFEKFQIMEPKQRKNRTLRHFKSKPLTVTPPPNKKKLESHQGPLWQKLHVARLFAKPTFQFLHVWTPAWRSVVLGLIPPLPASAGWKYHQTLMVEKTQWFLRFSANFPPNQKNIPKTSFPSFKALPVIISWNITIVYSCVTF